MGLASVTCTPVTPSEGEGETCSRDICDGAALVRCTDGVEAAVDCAADFGVGAVCVATDLSGANDFCAASAGCFEPGDETALLCADATGEPTTCVIGADGAGTCGGPVVDVCAANNCLGPLFVSTCDPPTAFDCADVGAACTLGGCVVAPGNPCVDGVSRCGGGACPASGICPQQLLFRLASNGNGKGTVIVSVDGVESPISPPGEQQISLGAAVVITALPNNGTVLDTITCTPPGGGAPLHETPVLVSPLSFIHDAPTLCAASFSVPILIELPAVGGSISLLGTPQICDAVDNDGPVDGDLERIQCTFETINLPRRVALQVTPDLGLRSTLAGTCTRQNVDPSRVDVDLDDAPASCRADFTACVAADVAITVAYPNGDEIPVVDDVLQVSIAELEREENDGVVVSVILPPDEVPEQTQVLSRAVVRGEGPGGRIGVELLTTAVPGVEFPLTASVLWCGLDLRASNTVNLVLVP